MDKLRFDPLRGSNLSFGAFWPGRWKWGIILASETGGFKSTCMTIPKTNLQRPGGWRATARRLYLLWSLGLMCLLPVAAPAAEVAAQPGWVAAEYIFETAPFPSCHASTVAETPAGELVAAWFGGKHEKNPDVGIWVARRESGGWTSPVEVANGVQHDAKRYPCWNPVLFQAPEHGPLMLFYKVGPSPHSWWGMLITSADGGRTWSAPRRLPEDVIGPVKNKPVRLPNGDLLCGASTEDGGWRVHFERTPDLGRSWSLTEPVNQAREIGAIQPSILFHPDGRLSAVGRTEQRRIFEIWSSDKGRTWGPMVLTSLPNPNSGIDAVTLRDGRQLLVYNHTNSARSPLNVAVAPADGPWGAALVLEDRPGGEFSYPAVIQTADGRVHVVYTWDRKRIKHVVLDPARFQTRPFVDGHWPR